MSKMLTTTPQSAGEREQFYVFVRVVLVVVVVSIQSVFTISSVVQFSVLSDAVPLVCFELNFIAARAVIGREHREKIILSRDWFKKRACAYSTNI
jgi:hypothetical protein